MRQTHREELEHNNKSCLARLTQLTDSLIIIYIFTHTHTHTHTHTTDRCGAVRTPQEAGCWLREVTSSSAEETHRAARAITSRRLGPLSRCALSSRGNCQGQRHSRELWNQLMPRLLRPVRDKVVAVSGQRAVRSVGGLGRKDGGLRHGTCS